MNNPNKTIDQSAYAQQESRLSNQSAAFISMLTKRGMLEEQKITDEKIRKAEMDKKRKMHHNTLLMLQNYRNIVWMLECFPSHIAEELDRPMQDLDALLSLVDTELGMNNRKLENRLQSVQRSRLLLDRINEALTVLKQKPKNGQVMYRVIFETYITPEQLNHNELLYRLDISSRHYYRIRQQAINILSIRLWAVPAQELDAWLEILTLLEAL